MRTMDYPGPRNGKHLKDLASEIQADSFQTANA